MKVLISILLAVLMMGCSTFNNRVEFMYQVDTIHCNGEGFKSYSEIYNAVVFTCKDGTRGRLETD